MGDYFKSHMPKFCFVALAVVIAIYVYTDGHCTDFLIHYNSPLSTLSYVAVMASAVFVAYQAILIRRDYKTKIEHAEFEKAYRLAGYYSKAILPKCLFARNFLVRIAESIDRDYTSKMDKFDKFTPAEAKKLFGENVIEEFRKKWRDTNNIVIDYALFEFMKNSNIPFANLFDNPNSGKNLKKQRSQTSLADWQIVSVLNSIINMLNEIEYFSTYFCSGLAAPTAVYMILHQTYLDFVRYAYLLICYLNSQNSPGHEYYAHTISLYHQWNYESKKRNEKIKSVLEPEKPKKVHS